MTVPILTLPPDEVHVWLAFAHRITDDAVLAACRAVIATDEQAATDRFVFARHRHLSLLTRALVRDLLSRYTGESPSAWEFERNRYGRPEIASPAQWRGLRFNLSHTDGLIACAITRDREIGIDVEPRERKTSILELAPTVFSAREQHDLLQLDPADQRDRFFTLWTLKEAYIKARGMGLSLPLEKFSFTFPTDRAIAIQIDPSLDDEASTWQFERGSVDATHAIALAVRRAGSPPLRVSYQETVPLTGLRTALLIR